MFSQMSQNIILLCDSLPISFSFYYFSGSRGRLGTQFPSVDNAVSKMKLYSTTGTSIQRQESEDQPTNTYNCFVFRNKMQNTPIELTYNHALVF
jgi:hypothetical protein